MRIHDMRIEMVRIDLIQQHPDNANNGDVDLIEESIRVNGMYAPVWVQRSTGYIVKGNHTYLAAYALGADEIPVIYLDIDDLAAKRIMVVDNEATRKGFNDEAQLAQLLREINESEIGLRGSGYDGDDLRRLERTLDTPLDFDANPVTDDRLEPVKVPKVRNPFSITPVIDDDGNVYSFEVAKEGFGPLSRGDYALIHKLIVGVPPKKSDVDAFVVPQWRS